MARQVHWHSQFPLLLVVVATLSGSPESNRECSAHADDEVSARVDPAPVLSPLGMRTSHSLSGAHSIALDELVAILDANWTAFPTNRSVAKYVVLEL